MDPISQLLTKIRNAQVAGHESVRIPYSKLKESVAKILEKNGFIASATVSKEKYPELKITLRSEKPVTLKQVSKPGQRIYTKYTELKRVKNGLGISIVSTSQGLMTDKQARAKKIGGELICTVS